MSTYMQVIRIVKISCLYWDMKSSKCKIILTSRSCPYQGSSQGLPLRRPHGHLQSHTLFGKAKAKGMESLEEGQERYPDQKELFGPCRCFETDEAAPICSWQMGWYLEALLKKSVDSGASKYMMRHSDKWLLWNPGCAESGGSQNHSS